MALPLPNVVANVGSGGQIVDSLQGISSLKNSLLKNKVMKAEADYAPYRQYSDAMSKLAYANYLPFQLQAQALSNPMLWMSMQNNPQAAQEMINSFSKSIPQAGTGFGMGSLPVPGHQSEQNNSLLSMLMNRISGVGQDQAGQAGQTLQNTQQPMNPLTRNTMQPQQNMMSSNLSSTNGNGIINPLAKGYSPLVPATGGSMNAMMGKMTAPYNEQPYKPGSSFNDPMTGSVISAPGKSLTDSLQTSINSIQRVTPILKRLSTEGKDFFTAKGMSKKYIESLGNFAFGQNNDLPSKYATFQADLKKAPEALIKDYGLRATNHALELMADTVKPVFGESAKTYEDRILSTLEEIRKEQGKLAIKQLKGGMNLDEIDKEFNGDDINNSQEIKIDNIAKSAKDGKTYHKINGKWYPAE